MEKSNLSTPEGRQAAVKSITDNCKARLVVAGVLFSDNVLLKLDAGAYSGKLSITIRDDDPKSSYYGRSAFGSDVDIYDRVGWPVRGIEISFGSCGCFTPDTNPSNYWKTIHASSLLVNWEKVKAAMFESFDEMRNLRESIEKGGQLC